MHVAFGGPFIYILRTHYCCEKAKGKTAPFSSPIFPLFFPLLFLGFVVQQKIHLFSSNANIG